MATGLGASGGTCFSNHRSLEPRTHGNYTGSMAEAGPERTSRALRLVPMRRLFLSFATFLSLLFCVPPALSQAFSIKFETDAHGGYFWVWDTVQDRLIAYRDVDQPGVPALRLFGKDGTSYAVIAPLGDFPEARSFIIWGVAGTPDGGVAVAAIVDYGNHTVKSLVLSYDGAGTLKKLWDVHPYHHHRLAVDREGNIFALGERGDRRDSNYSLFVKYSPSAKVLREFLPGTSFPMGDDVVGTDGDTGEHQMYISGEELVLFLAPTRELLHFTLAGELRSRVSLDPALDKINASYDSGRVEILALGGQRDGTFIAQVRLWPKSGSDQPIRFGMMKVSPDGLTAGLLEPPALTWKTHFLGTNSAGKLLFLEDRGTGSLLLQRY